MQIEESLEVVYTAYCPRCVKDVSSNNDSERFAKELHEKGWRVDVSGDMICPECVKKIIK